jgi:hypothetical protein
VNWWEDADLLRTASGIAKRFRGYVEFDDVVSELVVWCLEDVDRAKRLFDAPVWFKCRRLWTIGQRYARREKSSAVGYELVDEVFYSHAIVRRILPDAFDMSATRPAGTLDQPKVRRGESVYGEWETAVADVRRGLELLSWIDYTVLEALYGVAAVSVELWAEEAGWTLRTAYRARRRAVDRLVELLGGTNPWGVDVESVYKAPEVDAGTLVSA